jgi:hypothetical protein
VETEAQRHWLLTNGFLYAQGFHFAPPMPLGEAIAWLHALPPSTVGTPGAGEGHRLARGPRRLGRRLRGALGRLLPGD